MKSQKSALIAAGFMFFGLLSCNNESSTDVSNSIENIETTPAVQTEVLPPLPTESVTSVKPLPTGQISSPIMNNSLVTAAGPISSAPVSNNVAKGLNPAHGQPGHDCTIAVGAPLKGAVAKAAPAPIQAAPVQVAPVQTVPAQASQPVAPIPNFAPNLSPNAKINPAHGQPGHDCSVAVGAALPGK